MKLSSRLARERERESKLAWVGNGERQDSRSLAVSLFASQLPWSLLLAVFFLARNIKLGVFPFKREPLDTHQSDLMLKRDLFSFGVTGDNFLTAWTRSVQINRIYSHPCSLFFFFFFFEKSSLYTLWATDTEFDHEVISLIVIIFRI
jgi:hypothetical protein